MVPIFGELSAGGQDIVLIAGSAAAEELAFAAKLLGTLTPHVRKTEVPGGLTLPATWPAVVQLAHIFGEWWRPQPALQAWTVTQMQARTAAERMAYVVPAELTPYPWQVEGAEMIAATGKALITDEPGTGKTMTAILGLVEWRRRNIQRLQPVLVVCPASVVDAWVAAWQAWCPSYRTVAWRGSPGLREKLMGTADVYVSSYGTARMDAQGGNRPGPLQRLKPAAVVIDECHQIKNHDAKQSQAVRRLARKASAVVALSGTPITHHAGDLWPTLQALEPGAWPSKGRYTQRYLLTAPGDYTEDVLGLSPYTEPEFRACLLGQTRRVAKADVLSQLPPKVYSVRTVELPTVWRKVYDDFETQMLAELPDGDELSVMSVLAQLTHLSGLASAAADVEITTELNAQGEEVEHVHLELKAPSWKVDALLEVLAERPDQQVLAFAPSKQLTMLAGAAAAKAGHRVGYIVGGQTAKERTAQVDAFQAGQLDLICATTQAGGVGITLTAASTVVFLQRPWSLVDSIQAEDRAHRIGSEQHESIEIVDVVASNTVDTRVRAVLREKAGQLAELVQDPRIVAEILGGSKPGLQKAPERKAAAALPTPSPVISVRIPEPPAPVTDYADFIARKVKRTASHGRDVALSDMHPMLHPWQSEIVQWAVRTGRAAIWADTGLGKTIMQLEWARLSGDTVLVVAPLAVCHQTINEAARLGITAQYVTDGVDIGPGVWVTNYERVHNFDPSLFDAVVLDEASILKNHEGKTRTMLIEHFRDVPRRLACTATPAPNDPQELTNQAAFLGVSSRVEMLAAYFIHDTDGWRLKGHARQPMFDWLSTWAVALRRPSDVGYPDGAYELPPLTIRPKLVPAGAVEINGELVSADSLKGVSGRAAVRKATIGARVDAAVELVKAEPGEQWLLWAGLNDEARDLAAAIPGAVNVEGSWSAEDKAAALLAFGRGEIQVLVTKPSIAAFGLNWQSCARMAFVGLSDSYEQYYQCIRRCWRYGQTREVHAHVVLTDVEQAIADNVSAKEDEASALVAELVAAMNTRKESAA